MRSGLTLSGIAVGIAAVILLASIGEGVHRYVLAEFSQFGTHVIGISPGRNSASGGALSGLPSSVRPDARALRRVPGVTGVVQTAWGNAEAQARGRVRRTIVYGVSDAALAVFNLQVAVGQFLPGDGADQARSFVVLGPKLKHELFGTDGALGERLRLGGQSFPVIGVLAMAVAALGSISLLVGTVGIVTIMTIAVAEHGAEIGPMMALGSQRRMILWLFFGEAVVLAVLGSLLDVAIGFGLAQLIRAGPRGWTRWTPCAPSRVGRPGAGGQSKYSGTCDGSRTWAWPGHSHAGGRSALVKSTRRLTRVGAAVHSTRLTPAKHNSRLAST